MQAQEGSILNRLERILLFEPCTLKALEALRHDVIAYCSDPNAKPLELAAWPDPKAVPHLETMELLLKTDRDAYQAAKKSADFRLCLDTPVHAFLAMTWFPLTYGSAFLESLYEIMNRASPLHLAVQPRVAVPSQVTSQWQMEGRVQERDAPMVLASCMAIGASSLVLYRKFALRPDYTIPSTRCTGDICLMCALAANDFRAPTNQQDTALLDVMIRAQKDVILYVNHCVLPEAAKLKLRRSVYYLLQLYAECPKEKRKMHSRLIDPPQSLLALIFLLDVGDESVQLVMHDQALFNRLLSDERIVEGKHPENTLIDLMKAGVHSSLLQWLIPRLPYNSLNGYDAEGKNPLCVAVEFNNKAVINAFLREPMHRIDYCAPPLIVVQTKDGKESKDKKDETDPCMPHKSYESKPILPYQLQVHRHAYIDCPTMNQLEYITKYQLNVEKPKRTECVVEVFTCFAKPVLEILLKQCGLPLPIVTKTKSEGKSTPSVGEKRKRQDYEEQSTHALLPT